MKKLPLIAAVFLLAISATACMGEIIKRGDEMRTNQGIKWPDPTNPDEDLDIDNELAKRDEAIAINEQAISDESTRAQEAEQAISDLIPTVPAIVDDLTSTDAGATLSANQGRVLDEKIAAISGGGALITIFDSSVSSYLMHPLNEGDIVWISVLNNYWYGWGVFKNGHILATVNGPEFSYLGTGPVLKVEMDVSFYTDGANTQIYMNGAFILHVMNDGTVGSDSDSNYMVTKIIKLNV